MKKLLVAILVIAAIALQVLGGYLDMTGKDNLYHVSKSHAWSDALFLLVLALLVSRF